MSNVVRVMISSSSCGAGFGGGRSCAVLRRELFRRKSARINNRRFFATTTATSTATENTDHETTTETATTHDVLIVGGGVVGCALGRLLTINCPSLKVGIVEATSGPSIQPSDSSTISNSNSIIIPPNPRSYALSPASLELLGLSSSDSSSKLGWYDTMQVWEENQPAALILDAKDDLNSEYLGAVVEDTFLRQTLWEQLLSANSYNNSNCTLYTNTTVSNFQLPSSAQNGLVSVELQPTQTSDEQQEQSNSNTNTNIQTRLLVAADGARSSITQRCTDNGLLSYTTHEYNQRAMTFTVELEDNNGGLSNHNKRAFQRFLDDSNNGTGGGGGPLALLPTCSDKHAIVVWSTSPETVDRWNHSKDEANKTQLVQHLNQSLQQGPGRVKSLFGDNSNDNENIPLPLSNLKYGFDKVMETLQYGPSMAVSEITGRNFMAPPKISKIVSPIFTFPLSNRHINHYALSQQRLAIIGDAAHSVHPMAGQGLNIGLQDVHDLYHKTIKPAYTSGMDVATFLNDYDTYASQYRGKMSVYGMHGIYHLFCDGTPMNTPIGKLIKGWGMNCIQSIGPLRRAIVQTAATSGGGGR